MRLQKDLESAWFLYSHRPQKNIRISKDMFYDTAREIGSSSIMAILSYIQTPMPRETPHPTYMPRETQT